MRKRGALSIIMGIMIAFGCAGCNFGGLLGNSSNSNSNSGSSDSAPIEEQLPDVIAALRSEGQYQAP